MYQHWNCHQRLLHFGLANDFNELISFIPRLLFCWCFCFLIFAQLLFLVSFYCCIESLVQFKLCLESQYSLLTQMEIYVFMIFMLSCMLTRKKVLLTTPRGTITKDCSTWVKYGCNELRRSQMNYAQVWADEDIILIHLYDNSKNLEMTHSICKFLAELDIARYRQLRFLNRQIMIWFILDTFIWFLWYTLVLQPRDLCFVCPNWNASFCLYLNII